MQILLDNGYSNVVEINGGLEAWTKAGYPVVTNIIVSAGGFTKVTKPLSLIPNDTDGTPLPFGSVIYHYTNGVTEVAGPDKQRILVALDADAATITTSNGDVKPATWIYRLPESTTASVGEGNSKTTNMYLNGKLILSIVLMQDNFKQ